MGKRSCSIWCRLTVTLFLLQGLWVTIRALAMTRPARSLAGCPQEWDTFGNKCYRMFGSRSSEKETWTEANRKCTSIGAALVSIHSREEQEFLTAYVLNARSDIWIGLHLVRSQNIHQWSDNTPVDFTYWEIDEPNFYNGEEECVHMNLIGTDVGRWNDHRCARVFPYVCQIRKGVCGGKFVSEEGIISSPNYPNKYGSNAKCIWRITVPEGFQVRLKFTSFKLEEHNECGYDYVKVLDGHESNSTVLGKFCGYDIPDLIISSGNKMSIEFRSDASYQSQGFTAEFKKDIAAFVELESVLHQLPNTVAGQKTGKLKQKRKKALKKKALLRSLEEKFMKP